MANIKTIDDFIKFINKLIKGKNITKDTKLKDLGITDEQQKALFNFMKSYKKSEFKEEDFDNVNTLEDLFNVISKK